MVEMRAGNCAEHENEADQGAGGGGGVLEQLQADVGGGQVAGHDPRADHRHNEQAGAEGLGRQPAGEIELQANGPGLDSAGQLAHDAAATDVRGSSSSATVAAKARLDRLPPDRGRTSAATTAPA